MTKIAPPLVNFLEKSRPLSEEAKAKFRKYIDSPRGQAFLEAALAGKLEIIDQFLASEQSKTPTKP